jgi:hypothetical protein
MPRLSVIAVIVALCFSIAAMAEDQSPIVGRILDKAVGEVRKHHAEYIKANEKPAEQAKRSLEQLTRTLIDEGKTENAIAALRAIELIDSETLPCIHFVLSRCPESKQVVDDALLQVRRNQRAFDAANTKTLRETRTALQKLATQQMNEGKRTEAAATLEQIVTLASDVMGMALGDLLHRDTADYGTDFKAALRGLARPIRHDGFIPEGWESPVQNETPVR